jgi:type VI secretion system protein ImpA
VAVWLLRTGTRLHGLAGFVDGLDLLKGLLERFWDQVHPALDASDNNDPTMRLNALAALADARAVFADLRAAALAPVRGSLTVRDVELGLDPAQAAAGETVPTEAGLQQALQELLARHPPLARHSAQAQRLAKDLNAWLEQRVGMARAPALGPLIGLLAALDGAVARAAGPARAAVPAEAAPAAIAPATADGLGGLEAIHSRGDAARVLDRVCEWIEQNEPSNPAPLLIRRAQRLMDKSFVEIVRDLAPDGLNQVELIAGTPAPS